MVNPIGGPGGVAPLGGVNVPQQPGMGYGDSIGSLGGSPGTSLRLNLRDFPPLNDLSEIAKVLLTFKIQLFESDTQQAIAARDYYLSAVDAFRDLPSIGHELLPTDVFMAQILLNSYIIQYSSRLAAAKALQDSQAAQQINVITPVLIERNNYESKRLVYNNAAALYVTAETNHFSNPTPETEAIWLARLAEMDAAYDEMNSAGLTFTAVIFEPYTAPDILPLNNSILIYNELVNEYNALVPDFNSLVAALNVQRAAVGLPLITPATYPLWPLKALMPPFSINTISRPNFPLANKPDPVPASQGPTQGPGVPYSESIPATPPVPPFPSLVAGDPANQLIAQLMRDRNQVGRDIVKGMDRAFEYEYFILRDHIDPSLVPAYADRLPPPALSESSGSSHDVSATPGAGVALATQVLGLDSPNMEVLLSGAIIASFRNEEGAPLPEEIIKFLMLLIFNLLSNNSIASTKPSLSRLGIQGISLAGNAASAEAVSALSRLEGILLAIDNDVLRPAVKEVLETVLGLSPTEIEALIEPLLAALYVSLLVNALSGLGSVLGAPSLAADLLATLFADDPELSTLFTNLRDTTTGDVISNSFAERFLQQSLIRDIASIGNLAGADVTNAAFATLQALSDARDMDFAAIKERAMSVLSEVIASDAAVDEIATSLALRITSEAALLNRLPDLITLDRIITEREIQEAIATITDDAELIAAARDEAIFGAQSVRQLREGIIGRLQQEGIPIEEAIARADRVVAAFAATQNAAPLFTTPQDTPLSPITAADALTDRFLDVTSTDLSRNADSLADDLITLIFGSPNAEDPDEIRNPLSLRNQARDLIRTIIAEGDESANELRTLLKRGSSADFNVFEFNRKIADPGTMLLHSLLTGMSGSDAPLPRVNQAGPGAPLGKTLEV